ncbi:MAG: transposase, partial [Candidatus Pacebacteria bacterium]|nr:transposase [Candidatus Paceibacterota bacterium]
MAPKIPDIAEEKRSDEISQFYAVIRYQGEVIQELRDEIARLKGQKGKPKIRPGKLGQDKRLENDEDKNNNRNRRSKKKGLKIDDEKIIKAKNVPEGSEFKGHADWDVQCLQIKVKNIRLKLERWRLADGSYLEAELPAWVRGHYNNELVSYVMHQYYGCHVTQPLIWEQLQEMGFDISESKVNEILVGGHKEFHEEKDEILAAGLDVSTYVNVDDTGARHNGKNGYCTHIGNDLFAWFESTSSKSRINFL